MKRALLGVAGLAAVAVTLSSCGMEGVGGGYTGGGSPIEGSKGFGIGSVAPDFALPDQTNTVRKLSDNKGKIVVLAFYPADMTAGCSLEARSITQSLNEFQKNGVQVYGISVQGVASKKKFCEVDGIKYPLLADVEKKVAQSYSVLGSDGNAQRVSFIIGADGKVVAVDRDVNVQNHAKDLLKLISANKQKWSVVPAAAPAKAAPAEDKKADTKATVVVGNGGNRM